MHTHTHHVLDFLKREAFGPAELIISAVVSVSNHVVRTNLYYIRFHANYGSIKWILTATFRSLDEDQAVLWLLPTGACRGFPEGHNDEGWSRDEQILANRMKKTYTQKSTDWVQIWGISGSKSSSNTRLESICTTATCRAKMSPTLNRLTGIIGLFIANAALHHLATISLYLLSAYVRRSLNPLWIIDCCICTLYPFQQVNLCSPTVM